jgi:hypothetical protein
MNTVKIYEITQYEAYRADETGTGYSLHPYGDSTRYYKGYDDGGVDYIIPDGFTVEFGNDEQLHFYDNKGKYCELVSRYGKPTIATGSEYIVLKSAAAAALGRKGGSVKSAAKAKASAENGKKGGRPTTRKYNYTRTGERYPDSLLESNAKLKQMDRRTAQYKTAKAVYQKAFNDYFADVLTRYPGATQIGYDYYTDGNGHELVIIK